MCYHTSQTKTTSKLEQRFKVKRDPDHNIGELDFTFFHSNGFAHQNLLMIPQAQPQILTPGMWGIMPQNILGITHKEYYKESIRFGSGLNARSEKLFDHFIYRHAVMERRCLIPVDGFFEPHELEKKKYPVYVHRKDKDFLALAGIYNVSRDGYVTMAILTKAASPMFGEIHNLRKRQPVMIPAALETSWLSPGLKRQDIIEITATSYDEKVIEAYTVSKDVFSTKIDSNRPEILEPDPERTVLRFGV
ncbi:SOS response-associated peptidase [Robertkochia solimangrovi]|uniref:SOS response-associated peptidase n=1 Tax=Robertkochia solimangrovi TaxID=2213046 RepID=UPI00117FC145|nr:SOS response-associated peptidase [Robertkochia solimangrovi]TRZ41166.1 SOS response-associated peptidase [Robertkochia solimangrovi]